MKIFLCVALLLVSTAWGRPTSPSGGQQPGPQGQSKPTVVFTKSGTGPAQATVVHDPDEVDDVIEAAAKKAVDPQGKLTEDEVEKIIDPNDTLEDSVKRVVDPVGAARDAAEDQAERAEEQRETAAEVAADPVGVAREAAEDVAEAAADQQENAQEAAVEAVEHAAKPVEDALEREQERKEDAKDAAEDAIERQLDPTGVKGIEVDVVEPNQPVVPDGNVKVVLTGPSGPTARGPTPVFPQTRPSAQGPILGPRPVIVQPVRVTVPVAPKVVVPAPAPPPAETAAEAQERHAENHEKQLEVVEDLQDEVKDIAEDVIEAAKQPAGPPQGQNGKSSAAYKAPPL